MWAIIPTAIVLLMMAGCASRRLAQNEIGSAPVGWRSIAPPAIIKVPAARAHGPYELLIENDPTYREQLRPYWFVLNKLALPTRLPNPQPIYLGSADTKLEIALADFTGDGIEEVVTRSRAGPYLEEIVYVWGWTETRLDRILDLTLGPRSSDSLPWYNVEFVDAGHDGLQDVMVIPARAERPSSPTGEAHLYPPDRQRLLYRYNSSTTRMALDESSD